MKGVGALGLGYTSTDLVVLSVSFVGGQKFVGAEVRSDHLLFSFKGNQIKIYKVKKKIF